MGLGEFERILFGGEGCVGRVWCLWGLREEARVQKLRDLCSGVRIGDSDQWGMGTTGNVELLMRQGIPSTTTSLIRTAIVGRLENHLFNECRTTSLRITSSASLHKPRISYVLRHSVRSAVSLAFSPSVVIIVSLSFPCPCWPRILM